MKEDNLPIVRNHYFCSAKLRPSACVKVNQICCIHCDAAVNCVKMKHTGTKPCTTKIASMDDVCEFSI